MASQSGLPTCPRDGGTHQPPPHTPRLPPEGRSHLCSSSCREKMMQDAGLTYQQFKNCTDNLNAWLERLPHNKVRPSDGPSQIAYKLQAQKVRSWGCRGCGPASPPASYPELSPQARPSSLAAFLTGRAACARVARPLVASVLMTSKLRPQRLCFLHHHPRHSKSLFCLSARISSYSLIFLRSSSYSFLILSCSNPVNLLNCISRIALA